MIVLAEALAQSEDTRTEGLRDVKGPEALPLEWTWIVLMVLGCLLCAAGLFGFFWNRRRTHRPEPVEERKLLPWEKALSELRVLAASDDLSRNRFDSFYSRLSEIVRVYFEERFSIRAPEMTSEEFLHSLQASRDLSDDQKDVLKEFCHMADMVKFARFAPRRDEAENALEFAVHLIEETRPKEAAEEREPS